MQCPVCYGEVSMAVRHFMIAVDIPYLNIFFHFDCYKGIKDNEILHEYINKWYNYIIIQKGIEKNVTL